MTELKAGSGYELPYDGSENQVVAVKLADLSSDHDDPACYDCKNRPLRDPGYLTLVKFPSVDFASLSDEAGIAAASSAEMNGAKFKLEYWGVSPEDREGGDDYASFADETANGYWDKGVTPDPGDPYIEEGTKDRFIKRDPDTVIELQTVYNKENI